MNAPLPEAPELQASVQGRLERASARLQVRSPLAFKGLKLAGMLLGALLFVFIISVPFDLLTQGAFGALCFVAAVLLRRSASRLAILAMIVLSLVMSLRYMYWRMTSTLGFENGLDMVFGLGLLLAELYALVVLLCGYLQTCWPLRRNPVLMQGAPDTWPVVDVFIPTYNESLSIVKLTVFAAQAIDWPRDKLRVHLLDDGKRDEFREFCGQIGVNYITRDNNLHAKAGNLNEALKVTSGEYVAIFDADHVPTRSFLQMGMGWFIKDPRLSMLQTPHFFFSPDPFEKNLDTFRSVPNEGELFYGVVQDGNDLWNAAFFCGSCAIMRRQALEEIGGVATETVTEDAHTALKLSRAGYNTAYLAIPQAAGLATESLSRHIRQRIRWARGMAQIFRTDNPLLGRGLTLGQRFCYFNAMLHFFYGLPRLVFLTAPLAFLFFDARIFHASALMITVYVLPHILHSNITNSTMQGRFRHSFWNEVYETVLAWYIMGPVLMALINPRFGGFDVTDKGGIIDKKYFEWRLARPYIVLLILNLTGLMIGIGMLIEGSNEEGAMVTVLINLAWTVYNVIITGAAVAVASETRQVRREPRVAASLPIRLERADGSVLDAVTLDFSQQGLGFRLPEGQTITRGEALQVVLFRKDTLSRFPATVVFSHGAMAGVQFDHLTLRQQSDLVRLTFSRADTWAATWGRGTLDTPLKAMREVCGVSLRGVRELLSATGQLWRTRRTPQPAPDSVMEKS
ncbi:UDP-forming cellulose synthase catalytic subunit [Pseudomonas syringae]|nr:UDP-forming cellulose synthase catalytic subunit [Pseudomonas syringae]MBD8577321.1 UDP-forming cellulose synthase catalytic subunit [Pseudomonas syringae]MBD8793145.1 UDP-forming cellulose synthase catalytic subunit [Pseudomonas syringae]MBD8802882.1 UDP-forming cellulose synthase catalytic subunit [Pseudomonas syringae]MBD8813594.1 UDP-forming cellulose synthase catalytic subunit [Pseudomonas syringae]